MSANRAPLHVRRAVPLELGRAGQPLAPRNARAHLAPRLAQDQQLRGGGRWLQHFIPAAAAGPSAAEYCRHGISAAGLLWFISQLPAGVITADTTTSDVCHMLFKPATVPTGWQCRPTLLNADLRWYSHDYVELLTGNVQATPPLGTRSYCEVLAADPATAHFVGKPTAFLSHGWTYKFEDVVGALASFAAATPGAPEMFFWFDCLSIDEHASQAMSQDWCVG